jgi:hypothetical protein
MIETWKQLPKKSREFNSFLSLIIDETIESGHEDFTSTYIRCIGKKCHGNIETAINFELNEITWRCSHCKKAGVITHVFGE